MSQQQKYYSWNGSEVKEVAMKIGLVAARSEGVEAMVNYWMRPAKRGRRWYALDATVQ
jgi:hypothetical protein